MTSKEVQTVGELVREMELDFTSGHVKQSKYVDHNAQDTLDQIEAYANSTHLSGEKDSQGREKPFGNIGTAAYNVWFRAIDIDRKHIRIRIPRSTAWLASFLLNLKVREWMRKHDFGTYLNKEGHFYAKYGTRIRKVVRKSGDIYVDVIPFDRMMFDQIDFYSRPQIEILELTQAELRKRIKTHGYNEQAVNDIIDYVDNREDKQGQDRDTKAHFIKLYEIHGEMPLSHITDNDEDASEYVQQMHVISFVGRDKTNKEKVLTLVKGREARNPYALDVLKEEDGRALAKGAYETVFHAQWMFNHSLKAAKDQLDLSTKVLVVTDDENFLGTNVMTDADHGDVFVTRQGRRFDFMSNTQKDFGAWANFGQLWKNLANEMSGISDAMLGADPKSGTAWRQTEAMLQESYQLFEIMTENRALALQRLFRDEILPHIIETQLDNAEEIAEELTDNEIKKLDTRFINSKAQAIVNKIVLDAALENDVVDAEMQAGLLEEVRGAMQEGLNSQGAQRFIKPDEAGKKTWKEVFEDIIDDIEIDITNEAHDRQAIFTTANTVLQWVMTPGFETNQKAQAIVMRLLEFTDLMSPVEFAALPAAQPTGGGSMNPNVEKLQVENKQERNING